MAGYRSSTPRWESDLPFPLEIFVDDIMLIEPKIGRRPEMIEESAEWITQITLGWGAISEEKKRIEGNWLSQHILLGFELDVNSGEICSPKEKVEGAERLVWLPVYDPGSKVVPLKALQELRGCITHWMMANPLWNYFARPIDSLLAKGDELGVWVRCGKMPIWTAYWHVVTWLREVSNEGEEWAKLFQGRLERCLPLSVRLSGNLDMPPVMWISPDATLKRIGAINWRNREFICCDIGNLFAPFVTEATNSVYISDLELLAIVLGIVVWATDFPGTTLGIADNLNALHWVSGMKAKSGISLQLLRTVLKWIVNTDCDFSGLYSRSHHNVSADHLTRLSFEEISRWAQRNRFKWADPFETNGNWASFIKTVEVTMVWEPDEMEKENWPRTYWNPKFGHVIDWNPCAGEIGGMCRENDLPMWVSNPKHSVMENWYRHLGVNVWSKENSQGGKFFLQVGLAKTEFEILDFQHHCEGTGAENAILAVPSGVGMPTDLRWNWARKFVMDSCVFW